MDVAMETQDMEDIQQGGTDKHSQFPPSTLDICEAAGHLVESFHCPY